MDKKWSVLFTFAFLPWLLERPYEVEVSRFFNPSPFRNLYLFFLYVLARLRSTDLSFGLIGLVTLFYHKLPDPGLRF